MSRMDAAIAAPRSCSRRALSRSMIMPADRHDWAGRIQRRTRLEALTLDNAMRLSPAARLAAGGPARLELARASTATSFLSYLADDELSPTLVGTVEALRGDSSPGRAPGSPHAEPRRRPRVRRARGMAGRARPGPRRRRPPRRRPPREARRHRSAAVPPFSTATRGLATGPAPGPRPPGSISIDAPPATYDRVFVSAPGRTTTRRRAAPRRADRRAGRLRGHGAGGARPGGGDAGRGASTSAVATPEGPRGRARHRHRGLGHRVLVWMASAGGQRPGAWACARRRSRTSPRSAISPSLWRASRSCPTPSPVSATTSGTRTSSNANPRHGAGGCGRG